MTFDVAAESYGRFMGRFSEPLSELFVAAADLRRGQRVLDVGCGPGALTARLVQLLGAEGVVAVDPSRPFVEAARARLPDVDVRQGVAEALPFPDDTFDAALAQLVVHFMEDPVAGLREMGRVTRPGGLVAACVWDYGGNRSPLSTFWSVVAEIDPDVPTESDLSGARQGALLELAASAGLVDAQETLLSVTVRYDGFEEWWETYTLGVGPAGSYLGSVDDHVADRIHDHCRAVLPEGPFDVAASAWCMRARVAGGSTDPAAALS